MELKNIYHYSPLYGNRVFMLKFITGTKCIEASFGEVNLSKLHPTTIVHFDINYYQRVCCSLQYCVLYGGAYVCVCGTMSVVFAVS